MSAYCGIDVGGTFTDLYSWDDKGRVLIAKTPTTPAHPEIGFLNVLKENNINIPELSDIFYGTTLSTNAMIEKKYPTLALVTTKGFRDLIEIGRYHREKLYDFTQVKERPFVQRRNTYEILERMDSDGNVITPFDHQQAEHVVREIAAKGIRNIAVCFLNSYRNSRHEELMAKCIEKVDPAISYSLSSQVLPKIGTLGRLLATLVNVCLKQIINQHVAFLEKALKESGFCGRLWVMQSNGGSVLASEGCRFGEKTLLSGPAGGVIGASFIGKKAGYNSLLTIDIGGTSADMSVIDDSTPVITDTTELGWDMPLPVPMVEVTAIGAGGGGIAWVDDQGVPKVGPESAGADPGPAFYGKGNKKATLGDAALVLGYLNPHYFAGKKVDLDVAAAQKAVAEFGRPLGLPMIEAAKGIVQIVNVNTGNSIREILIKQGRDPRDYTLFAYGGGGPLFSCSSARELSIPRVLVSPFSGVFSAFGMLCGGARHDVFKSYYQRMGDADPKVMEQYFHEMGMEITKLLTKEGFNKKSIQIKRYASVRYVGQNYEIEVEAPSKIASRSSVAQIEKSFVEQHKQIYGVEIPDTPTALLGFRVTGIGKIKDPIIASTDKSVADNGVTSAFKGYRDVHFLTKDRPVKTKIYDGECLIRKTSVLKGPAIAEFATTTVIVEPDTKAIVDKKGNIVIHIGG
ncbi:MAG: hydantoinase/oxoprolinase family protein [Syntrophales bacterium]|jgi:N-methylhydantoinase A|nr:hydantoinase/oxoprolinase family protein [Syntrophales bacterium]